MKLMVLQTQSSFSLAPYMKEWLQEGDQLFTMQTIRGPHMWRIFEDTAPDVVFVDFCDENAVILTEKVAEMTIKPRIVIRLHGYEAQSPHLLNGVDWRFVHALIVVSPKFQQIVKEKLAGKVKIYTVANGVDLKKFSLQPQGNAQDVAYCGYLNKKKGPTLLRTVMASLPSYNFHVAGQHQDAQVQLYMNDLKLDNVQYYGWMNTAAFLRGKGFIISTSVTESFGMSIAEGMAMGLTPAVHWWPGADKVWPETALWRTFGELESILSSGPRKPAENRAWIEERYSMNKCMNRVMALIKD
jgi:glycosyltransferase involved in cell wall biosynthesis